MQMTCCIEKSSIFAAAFGKCIYKVSNIQYYFNQKNMNYSCRKTIVPIIIGTLLSGACSNDEPTGGKGHQQTYSVVLKGITVAGEESSEELKDVSVFQFSDGNLYKEEQLTPGARRTVGDFCGQRISTLFSDRTGDSCRRES